MTQILKVPYKFPFPHIQSELLFPLKIGKVRGTSSSNLPRSVDACVKVSKFRSIYTLMCFSKKKRV